MLTAERTCNLCDGTLKVTHVKWMLWHLRVVEYRRRGLSEKTAKLAAGPKPDVGEFMACPGCNH